MTSTSLTRFGWESSFMTLISLMTDASAVCVLLAVAPACFRLVFIISFSAYTSMSSVFRASLTSPKLPRPREVMRQCSFRKVKPYIITKAQGLAHAQICMFCF